VKSGSFFQKRVFPAAASPPQKSDSAIAGGFRFFLSAASTHILWLSPAMVRPRIVPCLVIRHWAIRH